MASHTPEHPSLLRPPLDQIDEYEQWSRRHWLHPHGSPEAQQHARDKFDEETAELIAAINSGSAADIIGEAGDVVWTASATGSNAGMSLGESLHAAFPSYFSPNAPIRTADIDTMAKALFTGTTQKDLIGYLKDGQRVLGKKANLWFVLGGSVNDPERTFADAWLRHNRVDAVDALARTTFLVSFIAQRYAGEGLQSVLEANYDKIEQRLNAGDAVTRPPHHSA